MLVSFLKLTQEHTTIQTLLYCPARNFEIDNHQSNIHITFSGGQDALSVRDYLIFRDILYIVYTYLPGLSEIC